MSKWKRLFCGKVVTSYFLLPSSHSFFVSSLKSYLLPCYPHNNVTFWICKHSTLCNNSGGTQAPFIICELMLVENWILTVIIFSIMRKPLKHFWAERNVCHPSEPEIENVSFLLFSASLTLSYSICINDSIVASSVCNTKWIGQFSLQNFNKRKTVFTIISGGKRFESLLLVKNVL